MQTATAQTATRPFHEIVVSAIRQASGPELEFLAALIKATKVPKGHDEIIAAWNERRNALYWGTEDLGVPASLRAQAQASTRARASEKQGIDLDELQRETQTLLALLTDRHPGLATWNEALRNRLQTLKKLISQALGT